MSDDRRLADRAGKLASPHRAPAGPREVAAGSGEAPLAAILREIDETILPRSLEFRRGQAMVRLTAGNRRLIAIDRVEGADDVPGDLVGQALSQPGSGTLDRLRQLFLDVLSGSGRVMVWTDQPAERDGTIGAGATAAALAAAWKIDLFSAGMDAPGSRGSALDTFLATAGTSARAWVRLKAGDVTESGGDAALVARLRDFAASEDMANLILGPGGEVRRFVAIGRAPEEGNCLVHLSELETGALLILPAAELDSAKETWLRATA